jgi:hypothetical protein
MSSETTKTPNEKEASETAKKCPETEKAKSVAELPATNTGPQEDKSSDRKRPALTTAAEAPGAKRIQGDTKSRPSQEEIADTAAMLGYKAGDRFEVEWMLQTISDGKVVEVWWPATLLEYDGRVVDNCAAIRVLKYDPLPDYGYSEAVEEDVLFCHDQTLLLLSDHDDLGCLRYRIEGTDDSGELMPVNEEVINNTVNHAVASFLQIKGHLLKNLPAAHQAHIASAIVAGKELLVEKLMNAARESPGHIVTSEKVKSVLAEVENEIRERDEQI